MTQPALNFDTVIAQRDRAMQQVAQHAEEMNPGFGNRAAAFVVAYLTAHGPTSGEVLTEACKAAGIVPHSDKAFGGVYYGLSYREQIVKVGTCYRAKGHKTAGGNIWAIAE